MLDAAVARYRLFALNAQPGMPDREGVTLESPFVGPGMRGRSQLRYFPCRLSLVPALLASAVAPDVVLVQTTSFQHSYIVSEQGTAVIWGHDAAGQAEQIIGHVAHPVARQQLREAGRSLGLHL